MGHGLHRPSSARRKRSPPTCSACGQVGHNKSSKMCPKRTNTAPGGQTRTRQQESAPVVKVEPNFEPESGRNRRGVVVPVRSVCRKQNKNKTKSHLHLYFESLRNQEVEQLDNILARIKNRVETEPGLIQRATLDDRGKNRLVEEYRKSLLIPLHCLMRDRLFRDFLNTLNSQIIQTVLDQFGVHIENRKVQIEGGDFVNDASIVVYENSNFYKDHNDADGMKFPQRAWTGLLYLFKHPEASGGATVFPNIKRVVPCVKGRLVVFSNYNKEGKPSDRAIHRAQVLELSEDINFPNPWKVWGDYLPPVKAVKVVMNLWFNQVSGK